MYQNRNVFLLKQDLAPFSFWNTIYLSETYFKDPKIEDSVFLHEEIHVKQKHSLDILFVEVLKAIFGSILLSGSIKKRWSIIMSSLLTKV